MGMVYLVYLVEPASGGLTLVFVSEILLKDWIGSEATLKT